jgi:hypothetical protein
MASPGASRTARWVLEVPGRNLGFVVHTLLEVVIRRYVFLVDTTGEVEKEKRCRRNIDLTITRAA